MTGSAAVFLQTGFRTGGTWLWSRFRANTETLCFCEPLNEALEQITPAMIADLKPENSNLRHPTLETPYFEEFVPLLNDCGKGVKAYRTEFGLGSYFAMPDEQPAGMTEYLQSLIDLAVHQNRLPVLKFTRALARADWLKSCFPQACQIALIREPWPQFQSALSLAYRHDNYTFLMIPMFAISRPRDGGLKALCERLGIPSVPLSCGIETCAGTYTRLAREMPVADLFSAFLGMYVASHARCVRFADLVVVQESLTSAVYRQQVESDVRAATGINVDVSGYSSAAPPLAGDEPGFDVRAACDTVYKTLSGDYPDSIDDTRRKLPMFDR
jgi:hypothetical protein